MANPSAETKLFRCPNCRFNIVHQVGYCDWCNYALPADLEESIVQQPAIERTRYQLNLTPATMQVPTPSKTPDLQAQISDWIRCVLTSRYLTPHLGYADHYDSRFGRTQQPLREQIVSSQNPQATSSRPVVSSPAVVAEQPLSRIDQPHYNDSRHGRLQHNVREQTVPAQNPRIIYSGPVRPPPPVVSSPPVLSSVAVLSSSSVVAEQPNPRIDQPQVFETLLETNTSPPPQVKGKKIELW